MIQLPSFLNAQKIDNIEGVLEVSLRLDTVDYNAIPKYLIEYQCFNDYRFQSFSHVAGGVMLFCDSLFKEIGSIEEIDLLAYRKDTSENLCYDRWCSTEFYKVSVDRALVSFYAKAKVLIIESDDECLSGFFNTKSTRYNHQGDLLRNDKIIVILGLECVERLDVMYQERHNMKKIVDPCLMIYGHD